MSIVHDTPLGPLHLDASPRGLTLLGFSPAASDEPRDADAERVLDLARSRTTGTFDAVGAPTPFGRVLAEVGTGVGNPTPELTWVDGEFLESQGVVHWAGEDSLPLWLPRPEYDGMLAHDPRPAVAAGLRLRPLADTAPGCLDSPVTAITPEREAEVLAAWHAR